MTKEEMKREMPARHQLLKDYNNMDRCQPRQLTRSGDVIGKGDGIGK
jgi:hypothetical protein